MKFSYRDRQPILCFRNYTERATSICLPALFTHALFVKFCLVKRSANFKISARLNLPRQRQGRGGFEIYARIARLANHGLNLTKFDRQILLFGGWNFSAVSTWNSALNFKNLHLPKLGRCAEKTSCIETKLCRVRRYMRAMCAKIQRGILTASAQITRRAALCETSLIKAPSRIRAPHKAARCRILLV